MIGRLNQKATDGPAGLGIDQYFYKR